MEDYLDKLKRMTPSELEREKQNQLDSYVIYDRKGNFEKKEFHRQRYYECVKYSKGSNNLLLQS